TERPSSWRSTHSLADGLAAGGVVGIADIDTRALTRHLRERGVMRAGVFSGPALLDASGRRRPEDELLAQVLETPLMAGADLAGEVTAARPYVVEPVEGSTPDGRPVAHVVAVDLGIKSTTPQRLAQRGVRTTVVPSSTTA